MNSFHILTEALRDLPVEESAPLLLGAHIATPLSTIQIVEVEAYGGFEDPGSHAFRGPTPRTKVMFDTFGHAYIYFTYGNHWMLNVTARPAGEAGAILIRAAKPISGTEQMLARRPKARSEQDILSGPGKIAAALGLNQDQYGINVLSPNGILELIPSPEPKRIVVGTRIGIAKGKGDEMIRRYIDADEIKWASATKSGLSPHRP